MDKSTVLRLVAGVALTATLGFTHKTATTTEQHLCEGFIPANTMNIPIGMFAGGGLTEVQFNEVLDRMEKLYAEDTKKLGDTLSIKRKWSDGTVNASAQRFGNTQVLNMYGGLARHPSITVEGFALVACHELGHHQGGAPKIDNIWGDAWATNEGGSDYYAGLKCLRRFFAEDDNAKIIAGTTLDPVAVTACQTQFKDIKEQELCLRTSMAGQSVANFFQVMKKEAKPPMFGTPDKTEVPRMVDSHPQTQCRLDTYFAGMLCTAKETDPVDKADYKKGSCFAPQDTVGVRPRCWFKANDVM